MRNQTKETANALAKLYEARRGARQGLRRQGRRVAGEAGGVGRARSDDGRRADGSFGRAAVTPFGRPCTHAREVRFIGVGLLFPHRPAPSRLRSKKQRKSATCRHHANIMLRSGRGGLSLQRAAALVVDGFLAVCELERHEPRRIEGSDRRARPARECHIPDVRCLFSWLFGFCVYNQGRYPEAS